MGALGVPELAERVKRTGRRFEKGGMTEKELGRNKEVGARQVGEATCWAGGQRSKTHFCSWSRAQKMRHKGKPRHVVLSCP